MKPKVKCQKCGNIFDIQLADDEFITLLKGRLREPPQNPLCRVMKNLYPEEEAPKK